MQTQRFGLAEVGARYPLSLAGPLDWTSTGETHHAEVVLPALRAGHILVPSFSMLGCDYGFQIQLVRKTRCWTLAPVAREPVHEAKPGRAVSSIVDYFHIDRSIDEARLCIDVVSPRVPAQYLFSFAVRPTTMKPDPGRRSTRRLSVAPLSQLTAPRAIRRQICSPTCITMVLRHLGVDTHIGEIVRMCYHPPSRMFGVWPAAIHAASRFGALGAVEVFEDTEPVAEVLDFGLPVIASIRYQPGELSGAPQKSTAGHLVVCTGMDSTRVQVNDPCARDLRAVSTSYDRAEFSRAWLTHRGAAYIVAAP